MFSKQDYKGKYILNTFRRGMDVNNGVLGHIAICRFGYETFGRKIGSPPSEVRKVWRARIDMN
jgi:hypothetical protein